MNVHFRTLYFCYGLLMLCICEVIEATNSMSTIYVSTRGTLLPSCGTRKSPCKTLHRGIEKALDRKSDTTVRLLQGSYTLEKSYNVTSYNNFSLIGEGKVEITCTSNVGLAFILSSEIQLRNFKLYKCGGQQKSLIGHEKSTGEMDIMNYLTAIYISYCKNLKIQNVEITESSGVGITLTDVNGIVDISDSEFNRNMPRRFHETEDNDPKLETHAGGGLFLMLNSYEYSPINITRKQHDAFQHNGKFLLRNVHFTGNEARSPDIDDKINSPLTPFSRGGGLGIYLFGKARGNAFILSRCGFYGNRAQWGGGFQMEFKQVTENNTVQVLDTSFSENFASFAGGAARIGDITISKKALVPNRFIIKNCKFTNNTSMWGGGVSVYGTTFVAGSPTPSDVKEKFVFTNSVFQANEGSIGSALGVFLFNLNQDNIGPFVTINVVLENCTIANNNVITIKEDVLIGQGSLYTIGVPIISKGYLSIINNSHTSMVLDSAILMIYGTANFSYNTGNRGGALALYGNSKIRFTKNSKLYFIANKCVEKGGALYVAVPGSPQISFNATGYATHQCFFEYIENIDFDLWETEIVFQGNIGPYVQSGLSVYATSLQNCRRVDESRANTSALQWKIIKYLEYNGVNHSTIGREVSTDPINMKFDRNDWHVAPSEIFNASITLYDEIGNPVYGIVYIDIKQRDMESRARLGTSSSLFLVNDKQVKFLTLKGREGDKFDVVVRSVGQYILEKSITNLTLRRCNDGFHRENDKCVCSKSILRGLSRCDADGRKIFLKRGFWAGYVNENSFSTLPCPVNYCQCPNPNKENTAGECTYIKQKMCSGNRDPNSILCGECKAGYTAAFGGEACVPNCSTSKIAFFLLIGLGLILMVMLLMVISIDAFTGYLNAWLYSYQVIANIVPGTFEFDGFMEFIIGLANLRLRVSDQGICFTKGLDEASKLSIMYSLPAFLLFVVYVIAKLVKRFPRWRYSQYVKSPFSSLSTIFVLCYTNITGISLIILNPALVDKGHDRMFAQGELEYLNGMHTFYGILASIFLLFIVLPIPFLLIFQPQAAKCLRLCNVNMQSARPLFDKLQGCFKDEYRWCAAYYFISRLLILALDNFIQRGSLKRVLLETACVAILVIFVWLRPYKEDPSEPSTDFGWINTSDAILLTNLTLVAIFSSAIDESVNHRKGLTVFVNILAYVPLLVLAWVLYRLYKRDTTRFKKAVRCELKFKSNPRFTSNSPDIEPSTSDNSQYYTSTTNRQSMPTSY